MAKIPVVYILASQPHGTLYVGVTSNLLRRVWEHRTGAIDGFTKNYGGHQLVYFEVHAEMVDAIRREKQLKLWKRAWKIELIERDNPPWHDLWPLLSGGLPTRSPRRGEPPSTQ